MTGAMALLRRRARSGAADLDRVVLDVQGVGYLGAVVRHAAAGVADLVLDDPGISGGLDGRPASLVAVGDHRLTGRLECGWEPRHVRFVRDDVQRRAYARAPLERHVVLVPDRLEELWRARSRDLSVGGALLDDAQRIPLGARLQVLLELDADEDPLRLGARVIRAPSASLRVVRFEDVRPGAAGLLAEEIERYRRTGLD